MQPIVPAADITKMYRQVNMNEDDQAFQLIIWHNSEDEDLKIFKLKTVTYGIPSAPFLAIRCLHELACKY